MVVSEESKNSGSKCEVFRGRGDKPKKIKVEKSQIQNIFAVAKCITQFSDCNVQVLNICFQAFGKSKFLIITIYYNPL